MSSPILNHSSGSVELHHGGLQRRESHIQRPGKAFFSISMWSTLARASMRVAKEQKISMGVDFLLKSFRGPVALSTWTKFIVDHQHDAGAPPPDTRVLRKPLRAYGRAEQTIWQRVNALIDHYRFAAAGLPSPIYRELLLGNQVKLAQIDARGTHFDLWLTSSLSCGQKQEGEWTVKMTDSDGVALTRMAFSFGWDNDGSPTAWIGGVQGLDAGSDKRLIVKATRMLSGLRPKDAVLVCVQALAQALKVERLRGVSNTSHVLAPKWFSFKSVISRDYDAFWVDRGGVVDADGGYRLPLVDYRARLGDLKTPKILDQHRASLSDQVRAKVDPKSAT